MDDKLISGGDCSPGPPVRHRPGVLRQLRRPPSHRFRYGQGLARRHGRSLAGAGRAASGTGPAPPGALEPLPGAGAGLCRRPLRERLTSGFSRRRPTSPPLSGSGRRWWRPSPGQIFDWQEEFSGPPAAASRAVPGGVRHRLEVCLPGELPLGYYDLRLRVEAGGLEESGQSRLIVAPEQAYFPDCLAAGRRLWGFNLPLYALRSANNWGIGDFGDLMAVTGLGRDPGGLLCGGQSPARPAAAVRGRPQPLCPHQPPVP